VSTATPVSKVVFDASVALRAVDENVEALAWFSAAELGDVVAVWPDLVFAEAGHGLTRLVRAGRMSATDGLRELTRILAAPVQVQPLAPLVPAAMHVALERKLSVYDAVYAVLAEHLDATLVTADVKLAAATSAVVLING
jgi:predicted nucleic acid-binding protein